MVKENQFFFSNFVIKKKKKWEYDDTIFQFFLSHLGKLLHQKITNLYDNFDIYPLFMVFKIITFPWVGVKPGELYIRWVKRKTG